MPIITIYQGASGEGQELAESLAQALGYRCVGREVLVEASRRYGVPEAKLSDIVEKGPHWWERLLQDLRPYRIALQATLCELAHDGKVVYHGHLGHELLSDISHVLKVLLTASIDVRVKQVRARQNLTDAAARSAPRFADTGPDADDYGANDRYPIGDRETCRGSANLAFFVGC
jgi:cytidylate kinase